VKTVIEIFTAALHEEAGIPEADAYRIARKLLPADAVALVVAGSNEEVRVRILKEYNGKNVNALARKYNRHRSTIYRIVRRHEPDIEMVAAKLEPSSIDTLLCRIAR